MKRRRIEAIEEEGYSINVKWEAESGYTYPEALTIIFNNVRNDNRLLSVSNNSLSNIYVSCLKEDVEAVKKWLSIFGSIQSVDKVLILTAVNVDYDLDVYDEVILLTE